MRAGDRAGPGPGPGPASGPPREGGVAMTRDRRRPAHQGPAHRLGGAVAARGARPSAACSSCWSACCGPAVVRERVVPALTLIAFACHDRACDLALPPPGVDRLRGARGSTTWRCVSSTCCSRSPGSPPCCCPGAAVAPRESGHGEYHALLLFSVLGMAVFVSAQNLVTLFLGIELLSIPLYILCASETRREGSLESGLKYLVIGSVGSATLVYGLALVYGATGSTDFAAIGTAIVAEQARRRRARQPDAADRARADDRRLRLQGLGGAVPPVDAGRLRGRADADHGVHGHRHQGGGARRVPALLRRRRDRGPGHVGAAAGDDRRDHDHRRQRRRARPVVAEADAGLLRRRAGGLHARRRGRRHPARGPGDRPLPDGLPVHEPGGVRGDRRPRSTSGPTATT